LVLLFLCHRFIYRKMRVVIFILSCFLYLNTYSFEFLPQSNTHRIDTTSLVGKSKSFLKYARNEIYARHGYEFINRDLRLYFSKQSWYKSSQGEMHLNEIELYNIRVLRQLEKHHTYTDAKITFNTQLNDNLIYYISQNWDRDNMDLITKKPYRFNTGYFYSLYDEYKWVLECQTIPPEYIIEQANKSIEIYDWSALLKEQIEVVELNKPCNHFIKRMIFVYLEGPSDDPELYILGFKEGEFKILVHQYGALNQLLCLSDELLELDMTIRHDIVGSMFRQQSYVYNMKSGQIKENFKSIITFEVKSEVFKAVSFYKTKEGALHLNESDIIGELKKGETLVFKKYDQQIDDGPVYFESPFKKGWVNMKYINYDYFDIPIYD